MMTDYDYDVDTDDRRGPVFPPPGRTSQGGYALTDEEAREVLAASGMAEPEPGWMHEPGWVFTFGMDHRMFVALADAGDCPYTGAIDHDPAQCGLCSDTGVKCLGAGYPLRGRYIRLAGGSREEARALFLAMFGNAFCDQYPDGPETDAMIARHGLRELPL